MKHIRHCSRTHKTPNIVCMAIVMALLWASAGHCRDDVLDETYRFESSIYIFRMVDEGFIIYKRPDEYSSDQGFIQLYESFSPYLEELRTSAMDPLIQPDLGEVDAEFVFVNKNQVQSYYLNNYWMGYGLNWIPVGQKDYKWFVEQHLDRLNSNPDNVTRRRPMATARRFQNRINDHELLDFDEYFGFEEERATENVIERETRPLSPARSKELNETQTRSRELITNETTKSFGENHSEQTKDYSGITKKNNEPSHVTAPENVDDIPLAKEKRIKTTDQIKIAPQNMLTPETSTPLKLNHIFFFLTLLVLGLLILTRGEQPPNRN